MTRYADDWVVTCSIRGRRRCGSLAAAKRILETLGVTLHAEKTRIVHVRQGFEFLGYKIKRGKPERQASTWQNPQSARSGRLYAYPREKSIRHFRDRIRKLTRRNAPVTTQELIEDINPVIRGWGNYFCKAHVRTLFNRLDRWIVSRLWSHRASVGEYGVEEDSRRQLYGQMGLVNLVRIDSVSCTCRNEVILVKARMRENCTPGLSGGRRPAAYERASSDPTAGDVFLAKGRTGMDKEES